MAAQSQEENEKSVKPKEALRLVLGFYDNGYIDTEFSEFYKNEETGKRKKITHETASKFREGIDKQLGNNHYALATYILDAIGISSTDFARNVIRSSNTAVDNAISDIMKLNTPSEDNIDEELEGSEEDYSEE